MRISTPFRHPLLLALLATSLFAAGTLQAAPEDRPGRGGMFAHLDADKDGNITRAEHDAARAQRLAGLDANRDGFVSYEEHEAAKERRAREMFTKRHDENGDGRVSVDEMSDRGEGMFERLDADKDGVVSAEEARQARADRRGGRHAGPHGSNH